MSRLVLAADGLFDGKSGKSRSEPVSILVEHGLIREVATGRDALQAQQAWASQDGQCACTRAYPGCFLMPGLIDAHVHLVLPGDGTPFEQVVSESDEVLLLRAARNAADALASGVTTLRDCGGRGRVTFILRDAIQRGIVPGPRLWLCGYPFTITGGHCHYFGGEVDGPQAALHATRWLAKQGADFIKVMATGGGTPGTISWLPSFRPDELAAIARAGHDLGRMVSAHALCATAINYLLDAGYDQIEHGWFMEPGGDLGYDAAVVERVAARRVPVTSTLAVGHWVVAAGPDRCDEDLVARWRVILERTVEGARKMHDAGVKLVAGTDAGWRFTPFKGMVEELRLLASAMGSGPALLAATGWAAEAIGCGDRGEIRPGRLADLVVVPGDPVEKPDNLGKVRAVWLGGEQVFEGG